VLVLIIVGNLFVYTHKYIQKEFTMDSIQNLQDQKNEQLKDLQWQIEKEMNSFTNTFPDEACRKAAWELREKYENFNFYVINSMKKSCSIQFGLQPWSPMYNQNNILTVTVYQIQGKWKIKFEDIYTGKTTIVEATIDLKKTSQKIVDIISKNVETIMTSRRLACRYTY